MEELLIEKLKNGDEAAFRELVEKYTQSTVNICFGFVKNRKDAEDVAQDVFIEVFRSIQSFRGDAKLSTWLYRIAVRKSIDFLRRKKRQARFRQLTSMFYEYNTDELPQFTDLDMPDRDVINKERRELLDRAIARLSVDQQTAIVLNKLQDYSYKETAEIMGRSVSSVESLLFRGTRNLRKILYSMYEKKLL